MTPGEPFLIPQLSGVMSIQTDGGHEAVGMRDGSSLTPTPVPAHQMAWAGWPTPACAPEVHTWSAVCQIATTSTALVA